MKKRQAAESNPGLTTGELSRLTGIPQQTLISWDRGGVLKAKSRRSLSRAPRRYDEAGLAAALFASNASQMGFRGEVLGQMVRLVQKGDQVSLERAGMYTYKTFPGMMKHIFAVDLEADEIVRHLAYLRDRRMLSGDPVDFWTLRGEFFRQAQSLFRMPDFLHQVPLPETRR